MAEPIPPLSRLRAKLAQPRGKRRIDALLADDDAEAAVADLSILELHGLVTDAGFGDSLELVALATPEQFRGCVDIDAWERDELCFERVEPWLAALIDAGYEKVAEVWDGLDPEFTALVIASVARVYDLSLGDEPADDDKRPIFMTVDRYFAVEITGTEGDSDEDTARLVQRLIEDLYRADPSGTLARHTLMSARSEDLSYLREMSYRWRSGRMADLGYVDHIEALQVFKPIDPTSVHIDEHTEDHFGEADEDNPLRSDSLPVPVAERVVGLSFLSRALDRIGEPAEMERLEMAILVLINKVLAAARVSPGDRDAVSVAAEHALSTLSLALESVSRGDLERAERALRTISLTRLHQLGFTLALRLANIAGGLAPRARTAGPPVDAVLRALLGHRPFFPRALDDPSGADIRPFASLADLRTVARFLTVLALRVAVADALGVELLAMAELPEPRPELDDHVRTALVHAMLGDDIQTRPLTPDELVRARGQHDGPAKEKAALALARHLEAHQVNIHGVLLPELMRGWLGDVEDVLVHLPDDPDLRFVDRLLVVRPAGLA